MRLALFAVSLLLTGCMSMPISTMYKMATLNPMELDPGQLQVAVRTDNSVVIDDNGVVMSLGYVSEDSSLDLNHDFAVIVDRDLRTNAVLMDDIGSNEQLMLFRLRDEDKIAVRQFQQQVMQHQEQGGEGSGSFGIGFEEFCLTEAPSRKLETDMFLQLEHQEGFFLFVEDINLLEPPCDECEMAEIPICGAERPS